MTTEFLKLGLHPELVQAVADRGYTSPTPIQIAAIPLLLAGQDLVGQAQTGTGKTAAYALPILQNLIAEESHIQGLIVAPTRELALQVAGDLSEYGRYCSPRIAAVYGGQAYPPQIARLKNGVHVLTGTPGRLLDLIQKGILDLSQVQTVVLDEADEMLSMGFLEDIERILSKTPANRQTALFSATLPNEIHRLARNYMREPQEITIQRDSIAVETIEQRVYIVHENDKLAALTRLLEMEDVKSALIFVRTRAGTGELANALTRRGYPAEALNGDLSQELREQALNRFRDKRISLLVATDVAARGLDIDDISHVINYDLPDDAELYVHRIGRTGRAGKSGIAMSLATPYEKRFIKQIEAFTRLKLTHASLPSDEDILRWREERLTQQVIVWLQRGRCRREREMVEKLAQQGFDPLEIAAAALKVGRAEEKQRPVAPLTEIVEVKPEQSKKFHNPAYRRETRRRPSTNSHEAGMVRLSLDVGREQGVRPSDIVGAIAAHADIPGSSIGKILIQEHSSLVDIPIGLVGQVLSRTGEVRIRKHAIHLQTAQIS